MTDEELKELVKASNLSLASRVHFIFDDYGNAQLCMFNEEHKPLFVNCVFSHVNKIDFNNPRKILTFSLNKFIITNFNAEFVESIESYRQWDKVSEHTWSRENHHN